MAPTREQLIENIKAMESQGAPPADIQSYLDSFKGQSPTPSAPVSRATPASNIGAPQEQDGLLKSIVKAPIKALFVKPAARATEALGRLGVFGKQAKEGYEAMADEGQDLSTPFGRYKIEPVKTGVSGVKQIAGETLEAGSYLVGGGGAAAVGKGAVRSTVGKGFVTGAREGAKAGAIYGGGEALQRDEDLGGVIKGTATGAAVGGIAGGATGAAFTAGRNALLGKISTPEEATRAAGKVLQGESDEAAIGAKVLSKIDTTAVKTYDDLSRTLESNISKGVSQVDEAFAKSNQSVPLKQLDRTVTAKVGNRDVSATSNFVKEALDDMTELYTKTRNQTELLRLKSIAAKAKTQGLTPTEINAIAREYGTTFKQKAFNKIGDPLTSVNAVTYENTRKGVKEIARSLLPDENTRAMDKEVSQMIRVKTHVDRMKENVNKLEQRINQRGLIEKLFRGIANVADVATFGGPKAFITKLFFPSNVGLKTMNAIDLQDQLVKNLRVIRNLEHASDSVVISTLRDLARKAGLIAPVSVFGKPRTAKSVLKEAVENTVAPIPTARYTKNMPIKNPEFTESTINKMREGSGKSYFKGAFDSKQVGGTVKNPEFTQSTIDKMKTGKGKSYFQGAMDAKSTKRPAVPITQDQIDTASALHRNYYGERLIDEISKRLGVSKIQAERILSKSVDSRSDVAVREWKRTGKKPSGLKKQPFPSTFYKREE